MSERFIKYIPSENADFLQEKFPNCFLLLTQIAKTARRTPNGLDGLEIGDAIVGEIETSKKAGLSTKEYRNALEKLEELGIIETVFNPMSKKPQKRASKRAIKSKIVNLKSSDIWDINPVIEGEQKGDLRASRGRPEGDKQERIRKNKNEKEEIHTDDLAVVENIDNFSLELNEDNVITDELTQHNIYNQTTNSEENTNKVELKQKKPNKVKTKKSKEPEEPEIPKIEFRQNVHLTQEEYDELLQKRGQALLDCMLDYLDSYKGRTGKKYKSDYFAMKEGSWVIGEGEKLLNSTQNQLVKIDIEKSRKASEYISRVWHSPNFNINVSTNRIEFLGTGSYSQIFDWVNFDNPNFDKDVKYQLEKKKFEGVKVAK